VLTVSGTREQPAALALVSVSVLTVAGTREKTATVALVAVSTLTVTGARTVVVALSLTGLATLTIDAVVISQGPPAGGTMYVGRGARVVRAEPWRDDVTVSARKQQGATVYANGEDRTVSRQDESREVSK
jgi:hypothetical protein